MGNIIKTIINVMVYNLITRNVIRNLFTNVIKIYKIKFYLNMINKIYEILTSVRLQFTKSFTISTFSFSIASCNGDL